MKLYHSTFASAINEAINNAENKGFKVCENDITNEITFNSKITLNGKTNKYSLNLYKNGKLQRKNLQIEIYNENSKFELNTYIF